MIKTKYFRRSTVRLALVYILIFSVSVIALLGFIYWSTAAYMLKQNDITIVLEISGLKEHYQNKGLTGLSSSIRKRLSNNPVGSSIYLLTDEKFEPIIGNLSHWPDTPPDKDGWLNLSIEYLEQSTHQKHQIRARAYSLFGGYKLLVGRDNYLLNNVEKVISQSLLWGGLLTLLLAGLGGGMVSHNMIKRIEDINATSKEIMSGDLSKRIPTFNKKDEFDNLANNLNNMLDRIEALINDVQHLSDNIAHDLRTPLSRLQQHLENLQLQFQTNENQEYFDKAISEADNLLKTFNALLHVASIESAAMREEFYNISIEDVLHDVVELYEPLIEEKNQTLELKINTTIQIKGNRELLSQAFANLIDNAIKYTHEKGKINIELYADNKGAKILKISDTGLGIPQQDFNKVFQRFYRVDKSRYSKGNGLGLSLVKAVVDLHHINIQLKNKQPGLSVLCYFPVIKA